MTLEQLKLARCRLRLGIANVGFWVVTASGGLRWLMSGGAHSLDRRACVLIGLAVIVVQAAFDVIGGAWLMPRPAPAPGEFLRRWSRGVACHSLVLAGVGLPRCGCFRRPLERETQFRLSALSGSNMLRADATDPANDLDAEIALSKRVAQGDRVSSETLYERFSGVLFTAPRRKQVGRRAVPGSEGGLSAAAPG